jgi:uncharacterized protein (TIGR02145 family)
MAISYGSFTDSRDGYNYKTLVIGGKTWFAENFRYNPPGITPEKGVRTLATPVNPVMVWEFEVYELGARKYSWQAAKDYCPAGWHLPTEQEWAAAAEAIGGRIFVYNHKERDLGISYLWNMSVAFLQRFGVNITGRFTYGKDGNVFTLWPGMMGNGKRYSGTGPSFYSDDVAYVYGAWYRTDILLAGAFIRYKVFPYHERSTRITPWPHNVRYVKDY